MGSCSEFNHAGAVLMWRNTCRSAAAGYRSKVASSALGVRWISVLTSFEKLCWRWFVKSNR